MGYREEGKPVSLRSEGGLFTWREAVYQARMER